jgi:putative aldouronate transport system permease protein
MLIPGIVYFVYFKYGPMWGQLMAFQNYNPFLGILKSPWVGLKHFERFVTSYQFAQLFRNTLLLAIYNLVFFFPFPILLALLLNEMDVQWVKGLYRVSSISRILFPGSL